MRILKFLKVVLLMFALTAAVGVGYKAMLTDLRFIAFGVPELLNFNH